MILSSSSDATFTEAEAQTFDLRGLNCPLPVLRTAKILRKSRPGALLRVECTDPLAAIDIPHYIGGTSHILERQICEDNLLIFYIRRS